MSDLIVNSPAADLLPSAGTAAVVHSGTSVLSAADDRILIERAQAGDRPAFELLVQRYDRQVLRLALNVLGSAEDARDVYQEAFLKIYRNLPSFRFECAFYTWIYRIVTNICLDHLRRRRSHPEEQPPLLRAPPVMSAATAISLFISKETEPIRIRSARFWVTKSAARLKLRCTRSRRESEWFLK